MRHTLTFWVCVLTDGRAVRVAKRNDETFEDACTDHGIRPVDIQRAWMRTYKTRVTRESKLTQYNRDVVRYWGHNPDQHNMRYQRMNFYKHICEKNNTSEVIYTMHTNINMRVNDPVISYCDTYKKQYMSLLLDSFWRRQSTSTLGGE